MKNTVIIRLIKGFLIGASMLVPGASGGTMAIILGIYDELIHAVSTLRYDFKVKAMMLGQYSIAGIIGILIFSGPMLSAVTLWNKPMMFLFLGAIIASIPPLYRRVKVSRVKSINIIVGVFGALVAISARMLPNGMFEASDAFNFMTFIMLFAAGFVIAVALVLPGISASYILLILGIYNLTLTAIREFNLLFLIPLSIGVILGIFLTAGVLEREMKNHPQFTYMIIIGFMAGSLVDVFPGVPEGMDIIFCILTFAFGFGAIFWIGRDIRVKKKGKIM